MCMSQAATVDLHVQRLQRNHPERQEVEVTIVPVNRPAKLALLGVDIEEVLRVLRHTHFRENPPDPPELVRSFKPTSTWNQYAILTTDDSEDTSAEAKLRRRGGSGDGENTSPSTSTEENSSATTLSTSCTSSDDSMPPKHSLPSSRKGGRQRQRQARARRQGQQLQESITEEFKNVICTELPESVQSREYKANIRLRPECDITEGELRERETTAHELQLQALRANMQRVAEESAELQQRLLAEMRQEVQDVAATAILERQKQQVEAQRASEAAAALAEEFRREHVQQMKAASEALAHQQAQALLLRSQEATQHEHQLRDLQRVSDEQRRQLEIAAHEHELLEKQLNEGRSVVGAALEAVDARMHLEVQPRPTMPETPFSSSTTTAEVSNEVAPEAMVVPGSTTTVDVRTSRGVSFELEPSDVHRRLSKLDFRSISVPAVTAIRELVLEHSVGREEGMLAERMFYDTAKKYREHDLASGSGPPVSDLPASELPSPELAGVALVHHVGREVAAVTADVRCSRCSRSPTPPVAIWECVLSVLPSMHQETKLVPLCVYCTRSVWPGAFDHFPTVSSKPPTSTSVRGEGGGGGGDDDDGSSGGPGSDRGGGNTPDAPEDCEPKRVHEDGGGPSKRHGGGSGGGGDPEDDDDGATYFSYGSSRRSSYNDGRQQREEYTRHSYALKAAKDIMSVYSAPVDGSTNPFSPLLRFVDEFDRCLKLPVVQLAMITPCNVPNSAFEVGKPILSVHILLKELTQHCFPTPSSAGTELRGVLVDSEEDQSLSLEKIVVPSPSSWSR
ncbi:hypothetical protein CYMTET_55278 [Cymbomonas tetramitiformis]|uniref:Uncharacterized protein n=1 Tax=Cymbomonas tetramitiformis TaxID=36881 RepID=A0AAE0EN56_9CHLO|nr:hypothetical protein CYMTET_55278 [Cymbomonas tetramitiformis]